MRLEGKMSYPQIALQLDDGDKNGARSAVESLHRAAWDWQEQGGRLDERDPHYYSMRGLGVAARNQVDLLDRLDSSLAGYRSDGSEPGGDLRHRLPSVDHLRPAAGDPGALTPERPCGI